VAATLLAACVTVPPEVVTLSQLARDDTQKLHDGYRGLVRRHFVTLRQLREQQFTERVLAPYIERAIEQGRLRDVLDGRVVWDDDKGEFVAPDPKRATLQKLDSLNTWYRQVASEIGALRVSAFEDLDTLEKNVLDQVDRAFGRVVTADSTIYAYLVSIQKLDTAQRALLGQAGLEDLPAKIDSALEGASEKANNWSEKLGDVEKRVGAAKQKAKSIGGK